MELISASAYSVLFVLVVLTNLSVNAEPCYLNTTTCIMVNVTSCLGAKITFSDTSFLFANDSSTLAETERNLAQWGLLQRVPECWSVIQPFLCSVYLPKCDLAKQKVELPNKELCERTREPCKVVQQYNGDWPDFLKCDAWFFSSGCGQTHYELSDFNTTGTCAAPLIRTTDETSWYGDIKGCGIQCQNPLFTDKEHTAVRIFIAVSGSLCMICTLFTLLTFIIDWKVGRRYPAVILFFISGCFFLGSCGWMVQFIGNVREDIICRADGTVRKGEPLIGSGESATCTIVFIVVYFFMMAGVIWFVMLAYSWDVTFKALGTVRDDLTKKTAYFHIASWCLPLVLTIACLAISEIDGDSLSGICFVGYFENAARAGFVLAPIGLVLIVGMVFLIRGLCTLIRVRKDSPQVISDKATAKIRDTIFRLGIFTGLAFTFVLVTFIVHLYTFTNEGRWAKSFKDYIYCQANVSVTQIRNNKTETSCQIDDRPSLAAAIVHIFAFFGAGVAMSSWSWTEASLEAWKRLFRRLCNKPEKKPADIKKHRMVAKAFKKKKKKNLKKGRLSFSYGSDRDDPLGMKLDMNSVSSQSLSSGYAIAMKKMARRRVGNQARGMHKKSSESDLSSTVSRVSKSESRRGSYESSQSQRISDIDREIRQLERMKRRKKRRKKRHMNRVQPVLEPLSSAMAALHDRRARRFNRTHSRNSDSSAVSKASTHGVNVTVDKPKTQSFSLSSNILSDSVTTNDSASEIPLPHNLTDFSVFTAGAQNEKGGHCEMNSGTLKGAKSSPSGSFRRGRKREYKLEMTETSFYQEDDENIEMSGNRMIHTQDKTQETAEMRNAMADMTEFMENVRAAPGNGRYSSERRNSGQRDPMGSGRLGSASSRGSRGSQSHYKEVVPHSQLVAAQVTVPDRIVAPGLDFGKKMGVKHWAGDYLVSGDTGHIDTLTSKHVLCSTGHKRQIGNNGRLDRNDDSFRRDRSRKGSETYRVDSGSSRTGSGTTREGSGNSNTSWSRHVQNLNQNVNILDVAAEHRMLRPKLKPRKSLDVLDVSAEHGMKPYHNMYGYKLKPSVNVLDVKAEHKRLKVNPNVDFLNVSAEHNHMYATNQNIDIVNMPAKHRHVHEIDRTTGVIDPSVENERRNGSRYKADILNVSEEHRSNISQNIGINTHMTSQTPPLDLSQKLQFDSRPSSEERRRNLKRKHEQSSAGSKTSERSQRSMHSSASSKTSDRSLQSRTDSASSKNSRTLQPDGNKVTSAQHDEIKMKSAATSTSRCDKFLASTILPGVEVSDKILNLVDYEDDGEYEDVDSDDDDDDDDIEYDEDLLETTSYDDELTEVSSLPC